VAIGPETGPESANPATAFAKPADCYKRAKNVNVAAFTPESIADWLLAPLYAPKKQLPPLLKKGSQAALAAAAVVAAAKFLKDLRRKADTFGPFATEVERAAAHRPRRGRFPRRPVARGKGGMEVGRRDGAT
jgi:hypothetical protein